MAGLAQFLACAQYECALFAAFWLAVGLLDELAVDLAWLGLLVRGRGRSGRLPLDLAQAGRPLGGPMAVFIPAWREAEVIGLTIAHALAVWPQAELRLYIGCYANDPATVSAAMATIGDDLRARIVLNDRMGPTTKADCLNRLYRALCEDERRTGLTARCVILHDAEQVVTVVLPKIR